MVENLTAKCLDWEEKYAAVSEEKDDLEKLYDLNEELQENAREVELQLREDVDQGCYSIDNFGMYPNHPGPIGGSGNTISNFAAKMCFKISMDCDILT